jgi:hypothetical protein
MFYRWSEREEREGDVEKGVRLELELSYIYTAAEWRNLNGQGHTGSSSVRSSSYLRAEQRLQPLINVLCTGSHVLLNFKIGSSDNSVKDD